MSNVKDRKTVRCEQFSDRDGGLKTRKLDRVAIAGFAPVEIGSPGWDGRSYKLAAAGVAVRVSMS
jgi:hypothetical protein